MMKGWRKRLQGGDKYANIFYMRNTRPISWIKTARKNFEDLPDDVQGVMMSALTIAAEGSKSDKAKKKSRSGIKTPQMDVDLIRERLKRLKDVLR